MRIGPTEKEECPKVAGGPSDTAEPADSLEFEGLILQMSIIERWVSTRTITTVGYIAYNSRYGSADDT